jgi:hypothetical protein
MIREDNARSIFLLHVASSFPRLDIDIAVGEILSRLQDCLADNVAALSNSPVFYCLSTSRHPLYMFPHSPLYGNDPSVMFLSLTTWVDYVTQSTVPLSVDSIESKPRPRARKVQLERRFDTNLDG